MFQSPLPPTHTTVSVLSRGEKSLRKTKQAFVVFAPFCGNLFASFRMIRGSSAQISPV
jgi:hypothetical protein